MTRKQRNRYNMMQKMVLFFTKYKTTINLFVPFKSLVTAFTAQIVILDGYITAQQKTTTGVTVDKRKAKSDMSYITATNGALAIVWARLAGKNDEAAILDHTDVELDEMSDVESVAACRNICTVLNDNISQLADYEITAATVTAINEAITLFAGQQEEPQHAITAREEATSNINEKLKYIEDNILDNTDKLIHKWDITNPDMVGEYRLSRRQDNIGGRHTGIEGTITDSANNPLQGKVYDNATNVLLATANLLGKYTKDILKPGLRQLRFEAPGKAPLTVIIDLKRGRTLHKDVTLQNQ